MQHQFKKTAALVGDPVRATIMWKLLDGKALTATELAIAANTSAANISMHLSKLVNGGLLKVERQGRHRYYTFYRKEVAYAIEAMAHLVHTPKDLSSDDEPISAIQKCRTCYDHLAGKTGVAITDSFLTERLIVERNNNFSLSAKGTSWFRGLDIDTAYLQEQRRSFLRPCLDWTERRHHMAGSLAAALLNKMLENDWARTTRSSRAVIITAKGQKNLYQHLKLTLS